jgi:hypothetical protein
VVANEERIQGDALDVLHDDARALRVVQRGVVQGHDIGMLKTSHQQRFALEALAELRIGGNVVVHDLDHDLPAQIDLASQIDLAHAAFTEESDGFIAAQKHAAHGISTLRLFGVDSQRQV